MIRLLLFHASDCTVHLMHYTMLCSTHLYSYMLDCALTEPESKIQEEQNSGKYGGPQGTSLVNTNLALDQGKPWYIPPIFL
jgi:hypothetical protein